MALIIRGKTCCSICRCVLQESDDVVATAAFISDKIDPLWPHSDAGIHRRCFLRWERREDFVQTFNATMRQSVLSNGTQHHMDADGAIRVVSITEGLKDA